MYIHRDITGQPTQSNAWIQVLLGPRKCGKSTLFASLYSNGMQEVTFDDLQLRQLANQDPALFLDQFAPPLLLDEVQYQILMDQNVKESLAGRASYFHLNTLTVV